LIPVPADFPGQLYIRRAIVQKLKLGENNLSNDELQYLQPHEIIMKILKTLMQQTKK